MPSAKLKPCPFCGSKAKVVKQAPSLPDLTHVWWTVQCSHGTRYHYARGTGCPVMPMACGDNRTDVVADWNTRHDGGKP